jgi:UDP-2,3-diacylglucosamine pyrophosphatase LpxH
VRPIGSPRPPRPPRPAGGSTLRRIVVSDLHLGPGSESEPRARAFASLVDEATHARQPGGLLLLGDIFDLPMFVAGSSSRAVALERWASAARDELLRIHDRHPVAAEAVRRFGAAGGETTVVIGNHDLALGQPAPREALSALLGAHELQPWIGYVPGELYAEHGQQYHDITATPTLVDPDPRWAAPGAPLGWAIDALANPADGPNRLAAAIELAAGPVRARIRAAALGRARERYRRASLPGVAAGIGLPAELLQEVDRLSAPSLVGTMVRVARGLVTRARPGRMPRDRFSGDLIAAARAIDSFLAARGLAVPLYVFGHSHSARVEALPGGTARYANAGAWTRFRPPALGSVLGPDRYPFLRIEDAPTPVATLALWNGAAAREEPYPAGDASAASPS